jgi:hypothetical protein
MRRVGLVGALVVLFVTASLSAAVAQVYPPEVVGPSSGTSLSEGSAIPAWAWALIGVAIVLAVTAAVAFGLAARRRRPTLRPRLT